MSIDLKRCVACNAPAFALFVAAALISAILSLPAHAQFRKLDDVSLENLVAASKAAVETLDKIGHPIDAADKEALAKAWEMEGNAAKGKIQDIMDRYALLEIRLNDEAWLHATLASNDPADRQLVQGKWKPFLVKVYNQSAVKADVLVRSQQSLSPEELKAAEAGKKATGIDTTHSWYRWIGLKLYPETVTSKVFVGSTMDYLVLDIFSRDAGMRAADLEFYLGGGAVSQGHHINKHVLFDIAPNK